MFQLLLLVFLTIPILEIYLLIKVGSLLGAWTTVFLVVFTAVLGAALVRQQGFSTVNRLRSSLEKGEIPAVEILEGVILLICGALLLTPGFFTDTIGFLGLIPPVRRHLIIWWLEKGMVVASPGQERDHKSHPKTIEGEFWRDRDDR